MKRIIGYVLLLAMAFMIGIMLIMGFTSGDWVTPFCERLGVCLT
jgi:hypothetical protein